MGKTKALSKRQNEVLDIIITSHIRSAAPIGSGFVSDILGLSSATIRNVMGELEDMGYLCKPHTSAGRIPTTGGYRYYVNHLIKLDTVSEKHRRFVQAQYSKAIYSIEEMLDTVSHVLSILTRLAAIACMSNLKFYMEGTSNMLDMPEFRNPKNMRLLLKLFDEKEGLIKFLDDDLTMDGVKIHISEDDNFEMLRDLSFITANYKVRGGRKGSLGIIGPVRMNYSALIPIVGFLAGTIEEAFGDMEIGDE